MYPQCNSRMSLQSPPKAIIFDLGDVLFTWSSETTTSVSAEMMRSIFSSTIWTEYECGRIGQDACYSQLSQHFSVSAAEIAEAFSQARDSLQASHTMVSFIEELKEALRGGIKVYAMSNISKEDWVVLSTKMEDWSIFDRVFTSGHAGMRKPDISFYHHVVEEIRSAPEEVVFIDDKMENVLAARSIGITSMVFDDEYTVIRALRNIFDHPIRRVYEYLRRNAKHFNSVTDSGIVIPDNFAQLLMLDTLHDW